MEVWERIAFHPYIRQGANKYWDSLDTYPNQKRRTDKLKRELLFVPNVPHQKSKTGREVAIKIESMLRAAIKSGVESEDEEEVADAVGEAVWQTVAGMMSEAASDETTESGCGSAISPEAAVFTLPLRPMASVRAGKARESEQTSGHN